MPLSGSLSDSSLPLCPFFAPSLPLLVLVQARRSSLRTCRLPSALGWLVYPFQSYSVSQDNNMLMEA